MSYKKASDILPEELLIKIQDYIDGVYIYIHTINVIKNHGEKKQTVKKKYMTEI